MRILSAQGTQVGDRVELVRCSDQHTNLVCGDRGTVTLVNASSFGTTYFVDWDSGGKLGLIVGEDSWKVLAPKEEV